MRKQLGYWSCDLDWQIGSSCLDHTTDEVQVVDLSVMTHHLPNDNQLEAFLLQEVTYHSCCPYFFYAFIKHKVPASRVVKKTLNICMPWYPTAPIWILFIDLGLIFSNTRLKSGLDDFS